MLLPIYLYVKITRRHDTAAMPKPPASPPAQDAAAGRDVVDQLLHDWRRERPELDVSAMAVVGRIAHLGRLLEADVNQGLREAGIRYSDLDVLATLRRGGAPYRLSPTELRKSVLLTSGAMTACLNRLEARGLIARHADDSDRRSLAATLTAKGVKLIDRAIVERFERAERSVAGLGPGERAELARLLRKLRLHMGPTA